MKPLLGIGLVAAIAFMARPCSAISRDEGTILIGSYSMWMLDILADGSGMLIYGSGLPNAAQIPKGTYDFEALRQLLPSRFAATPPSEAEQRFCFQITVSPPHRKQLSDDIVGHSYDRKLLDPLFETAIRVGKPFAPEQFKKITAYYPVVAE